MQDTEPTSSTLRNYCERTHPASSFPQGSIFSEQNNNVIRKSGFFQGNTRTILVDINYTIDNRL